MYRYLSVIALSILTFLTVNIFAVQAQGTTLLPGTSDEEDTCVKIINEFESSGVFPTGKSQAELKSKEASAEYEKLATPETVGDCSKEPYVDEEACAKFAEAGKKSQEAQAAVESASDSSDTTNLLGCAIKTGRISLNMIPHFISYMANWLLGLSGIISVLFIVLGGYYYIYGGLTDQKEKGKKTIANALIGMSLAILSWVIVSIIIAAVTS